MNLERKAKCLACFLTHSECLACDNYCWGRGIEVESSGSQRLGQKGLDLSLEPGPFSENALCALGHVV